MCIFKNIPNSFNERVKVFETTNDIQLIATSSKCTVAPLYRLYYINVRNQQQIKQLSNQYYHKSLQTLLWGKQGSIVKLKAVTFATQSFKLFRILI